MFKKAFQILQQLGRALMTPVAGPGQKVKQGQRLLTFNLNDIKEHAASAITPMIFTNRTEEETKRIRMN
ncbi:PTS glucose transporter subunit IIA [Bacillus atrophaeus]|uniref:PTS glucose transporter subunit IIA n=1 Tax=Bacillus atrophaeus TaxID=1452 RepID=UPI002281B2BD|nr:PTS glucose transporter subunit IIA [Bacillus atrophaeus]MCY8520258.1 PTS glucose transporter subunit IIA [Bacillus atrophaeus]MCY8524684.1 PTS glucose transporter subunit IIA [Bacillus atrophaeus]